MKRLLLVIFAAAALVPCAALAQTKVMTPLKLGTGVYRHAWLVGTWSCTNTLPSVMGGPASQTLAVKRSTIPGALFMRVTGTGFERSGYISYDASNKVWSNPFSYANGNYASETTTNTGRTTVWTGTFTDIASGRTFPVRDTYTVLSKTSFSDVGEYRSSTAWKAGYRGTCTRA